MSAFRIRNITWPSLPAGVTPDWVEILTLRAKVDHAGTFTVYWVANIDDPASGTVYGSASFAATGTGQFYDYGPMLRTAISRAALDSPTFGLVIVFAADTPLTGTVELDQLVLNEQHKVSGTYEGIDPGARPEIPDQYHEMLAAIAAVQHLEGAVDDTAAMAALERYDATAVQQLNDYRRENTRAMAETNPPTGGRYFQPVRRGR